MKLVAALATPIALGLLIMLVHSRAVTGREWVTPYQLYTNVYTPSHVYGFNNVTRALLYNHRLQRRGSARCADVAIAA